MCKLAKIGKNSRVLDPTCGSGSFLVQALVQALRDCRSTKEKENVYQSNIRGIEMLDGPFGLATTNMLIHEDGKSNVLQGDCFDKKQ
jgi:type I restriction-modification system DNA methylase subunit